MRVKFTNVSNGRRSDNISIGEEARLIQWVYANSNGAMAILLKDNGQFAQALYGDIEVVKDESKPKKYY